MQLPSVCGVCVCVCERERERDRVGAIFDLVPLDEALRWSLCWSSRETVGERAAAGAAEARECSGVFSVHSGQ